MLKLLALSGAVAARGYESVSGCGNAPPTAAGKTQSRKMSINDPIMGETLDRNYQVNLPKNYDPSKEYPVIYWFHWWGDDLTYQPYIDLGQQDGIITVYPEGMSDFKKQNNPGWTSWNIGDAGVTETCTKNTYSYCYLSCNRLNACGRCNAFSCYDDVYFVRKLMNQINSDYCIDKSRVHVSGNSNGGMFVYYLSSQTADLHSAYGMIAGQPMVGQIKVDKEEIKNAYIISLAGRSDTVLPPNGGIDGTGEWITESLKDTFMVFGLEQGCDMDSWEHTVTPYDNNTSKQGNLYCSEYTRGCQGRVMQCMHDGNHDIIPEYMANLTWWFWNTKAENEAKKLAANAAALASSQFMQN